MHKKALFLALALASAPAMANEWILSAGVGQNEASDLDCSGDADMSVRCNDQADQLKLSLSYMWDFIGVEAAYYDFGEISRTSSGSVSGEGFTVGEDYNADGVFYGAVLRIPFTDSLEAFGRVGRIRYNNDVRIQASVAGESSNTHSSDNDSSGLYGVGLRYRITDSFSLSAEYEQTNDIAIEDITINDLTLKQGSDLQMYTVGASFHF